MVATSTLQTPCKQYVHSKYTLTVYCCAQGYILDKAWRIMPENISIMLCCNSLEVALLSHC